MSKPTNTLTRFTMAAVTVGALVVSHPTHAAVTPYTADSNTLHLWHFDEASSPVTPAAGVTGSFNLNANNGATLNNAAFGGFGTSGNTNATANAEFESAGNVAGSAVQAADGSFTMEAMINTSEITSGQQLMSISNGGNDQVFQFRITGGELQFVKVLGGGGGTDSNSIAIPTTGANAFAGDAWFHAAVTYDGNGGAADNLKFYWTRVDEGVTRANLLASDSLNADLTTVSVSPFRVGNRTSGNNLSGSIDEVRVSDSVRTGDGFIFSTPQYDRVLLADDFNTASTGLNDDLATRQSGLLATTTYTQNGNGATSIASNRLLFDNNNAGPNGSHTVSPDVDLAAGAAGGLIAVGGGFVVDFDVNPIANGNDTGADTDWFAVSFGHSAASRTSTGGTVVTSGAADFGILFRDNGLFQLFDNGVNNAPTDTTFDIDPIGGEIYNVRLVVNSATASGSGTVSVFINGVQIDLTDAAGLRYAFNWDAGGTNYIALESRTDDAIFDNLVIAAIPAPAALPAGLAAMALAAARRRRR